MLRFWLLLLDVAHRLGAPRCVYLWILQRASNATDWGQCTPSDDGGPF